MADAANSTGSVAGSTISKGKPARLGVPLPLRVLAAIRQ
ncbi:MAG: hypothetical protein BWY72_02013 [Bacteroidetes bacterium ADurb.Bin416]|nr:MAG: hypothetical protein BWY72_02013 [Bacteroidetes bacterium ADurb.Bin416]